MSTLEEIEAAITGLSPEDLARFRTWFDEFHAKVWDNQIEQDVRAGKLDRLADQAIEEYRSGRCTDL